MAIISSTMKESRLLHTLYAYNAYYYAFNDSSIVDQGVLKNFSPSNRADIYSDKRYGMDSTRKLINWVIAADGPTPAVKGTEQYEK